MISITELILNFQIAIIKLPLLFIPVFHLPQSAKDSLDLGFTLIQSVGFFVPLASVASVGVILIMVKNLSIIWKIFSFIYYKVFKR